MTNFVKRIVFIYCCELSCKKGVLHSCRDDGKMATHLSACGLGLLPSLWVVANIKSFEKEKRWRKN